MTALRFVFRGFLSVQPILCVALPAVLGFSLCLQAQTPVIISSSGEFTIPGGAVQAAPASSAPVQNPEADAPSANQQSEGKAKGDDKKNGDKDGKGKDGEGDKKDGENNDTIKRPTDPKIKADPKELTIRPGADGRLAFSFHGQKWPDVLKWLADASNLSLDWQQLPGDYVNLVTQKRYSLAETRDLLNRLLLDRGYTMVLKGQVLSVFKIDKLEPSLLPRVEDEAELLDFPAYDFVKITFALPDELKADKAAEDIKPLLSPHAKVQPLLATNRLLVIGAVGNLRGVSRILNAEHAAAKGHVVPREFIIRHARADHVADQVMILLGLDPASRRTPQELQLEQSRLQLFTQLNQKGKDVTKYLKKGATPVHIAVNHRRNSILVNAPPAEMKIIERSIKSIDLGDDDSNAVAVVSGPVQTKKYKLETLDPSAIVNALNQIGNLEPKTQINVDQKSKTIFAHATPNDHQKIQDMIDGLDGSGRSFEVIWLRNLPADRMAATIHTLMVGEEEKENNSGRYYGYYSYRYGQQKEEDPKKGFRIDADIEKNRLLLWATPSEMTQVNDFLMKMGEIPGGDKNPNTVRMLDPRDHEATLRILEQIRNAWQSIGPNELRIQGVEEDQDETEDESSKPEGEIDAATTTSTSAVPARVISRSGKLRNARMKTHLVQLFKADDTSMLNEKAIEKTATGTQNSPPPPPPVTISISEDGRIVLSSKDTAALDRLEDLLRQVAPPAKDFEVFYLKFALASSVTVNLREFFQDAAEFNTEDNWWRAWMGLSFEEAEGGKGLSSKRKLRFIYDFDTNSILVSNASPEQLATVRQLIKIYDKAPSEEAISARRFKIFKLKHARAEQVKATLKEVYRDLLSSKDKEFAKNPKGDEKQSQNSGYVRVYGGIGSSSNNKDKKPTKVRQSFSGALSVGVDAVTNTVIISAQEEWIGTITEMIQYLDDAAAEHKNSVAFGQMAGNLRGMNLQTALNSMMLEKALKQSKGSKQNASNGNAQRPAEAQAAVNN